jgi:hypothetical protein
MDYVINNTSHSSDFLCMLAIMNAAEKTRNAKNVCWLRRYDLHDAHLASTKTVANDIKNQGKLGIVFSSVSAIALISSGLIGFTGPSGLNKFSQNTVKFLASSFQNASSISEAFGKIGNNFQESTRYSDQSRSDLIKGDLDQELRNIDDTSQFINLITNLFQQILESKKQSASAIISLMR